jgi:cytochrome c peroxidase
VNHLLRVRPWAVAASLMLVLSAEARQATDQPSLDRLWDTTRVTQLDGGAASLEWLAERSGEAVWLLRVQAEWCGTCQWQAGWTAELAGHFAGRVAVIDLLVGDRDNAPADAAAAERWRDRTGRRALTLLAEPDVLAGAFRWPAPLPRLLVVDARTRQVRATLANPAPHQIIAAVETALAGSSRTAPPGLVDGRFTADQWALIQGMRLPASLAPDPTNRVADDPRAATLGGALFFEKSLSPIGIACSNCHNADHLFAEQQARPSYGSAIVKRNVPAPVRLDQARTFFWDGRADSMWSQAVVPIEDAGEMASDRVYVAHVIGERYRADYEAIFGPLPDLADATRFPPSARPGTEAWAAMRTADREAVSRVLANVGKAIAAFERRLVVPGTGLDRYAAGDRDALTDAEKDGLKAFLDAGCAQCHFGPRLSNDAFHTLRFPTARADGLADRGRADVPRPLPGGEFARSGRFADVPVAPPPPLRLDRALGAFRTPGLRGVASTAPYGHGGSFDSLQAVIEAHRVGGLPPDSPATIGEAEPWPQAFDPALTPRIVLFLRGVRADMTRYP